MTSGTSVDLKATNVVSNELVQFLRCCYRFLNEDWPHANRELIPDQGFEEAFRATCVSKLQDWRISKVREMNLGEDILTASGLAHEIDLVALSDNASAVVELKHWESSTPTKNEVVIFFAKILDYVAANPRLMLKDVCPIFVSVSGFEESGLAACLGLGIHPVGPGLRPLPIIVDTTRRMQNEIRSGLNVDESLRVQLADLWAIVNFLCTALQATWVSSRCGYLSESAIVVKAETCVNAIALSRMIREANAQCLRLLSDVRTTKAELTP